MKAATINLKADKCNKNESILNNIFREIRLLRNEVSLLMPTEDIKEYSNPTRIKNSYRKALKHYPKSV